MKPCLKCNGINFDTATRCVDCGVSLNSTQNTENVETENLTENSIPKFPISNLSVLPSYGVFQCLDCSQPVSHYAETCPSCGRFYRNIRKFTINGEYWSLRIALGIILSYFVILCISAALWFVVFILFAASLAGASSHR